MKNIFYMAAAPPPLRAEIVSCHGTRIYCSLKTNLPCILCYRPLTPFLRVNYLRHFLVHTIKTAIQKLRLFRFSLY